MSNIATNARNDLYVAADGNLAMARGVVAVAQDCEHAMKAQLGEMPLALDRGVPTLDTVWAAWKPVQFEAAARALLRTVPNVTSVRSFEITRSGGTAFYTAVIQTTYGSTTIAGSLVQ